MWPLCYQLRITIYSVYYCILYPQFAMCKDLITGRKKKLYLWENFCCVNVRCEDELLLHFQVLVWMILFDYFISFRGFILV